MLPVLSSAGSHLSAKLQMPCKIMTFEGYALSKGVSPSPFTEPGMHARGHANDTAWRRNMKRMAEQSHAHALKMGMLREEYENLISLGEIRPPTYSEKLIATAQGNPDLSATQSARRLCEKKGFAWQ